MKRLITSKIAQTELEKIIGYLVTRNSGEKLNKDQFSKIIDCFYSNGGSLSGIKGKLNDSKSNHYKILHQSIGEILEKYQFKD